MKDLARCGTVGGLLSARAEATPERVLYTFMERVDGPVTEVTYAGLDARARAIGRLLRERGAEGCPVLLLFPCNYDYIASFFGCLYAGAVPIPLYPFASSKHLENTIAIAGNAGARHALSARSKRLEAESLLRSAGRRLAVEWVDVEDAVESGLEACVPRLGSPRDTAFLQYTSGSTGMPKGVIVTHGNLLANFEMIRIAMNATPADVMVSWLPMYHDMGLIGAILHSLYVGMRSVLLPTSTVARPFRWLQIISRVGGTLTVAPNFAYELCVQRVTEEQVSLLALDRLRLALNGSEPIRPHTIKSFQEKFARAGFKKDVFFPCYGLAEASLIVTGRGSPGTVRFLALERSLLGEGVAKPLSEEESAGAGALTLVSSGVPAGDQRVSIHVPGSEEPCPAYVVGEILVSGEHIAAGYWSLAVETGKAFVSLPDGSRALRTGDLGFLDSDGELFVTGRIKDLIIVRGKNFAPQDIEQCVQRAHALLAGRGCAAFSVDRAEEEVLVIVVENLPFGDAEEVRAVVSSLSEAVAREFDLSVYEVRFLALGGLLKTSSGKVRRQDLRKAYLGGQLKEASLPR